MAELDEHVFFLAYGGANAGGSAGFVLMIALTILGSGWSMLALVPMIAARRTRAVSLALLATLLTTGVVVALAKLAIGRARPCVALAGVRALFGAPTDPSFPSGHAAGGFAFAAFVATVALGASARTAGHAADGATAGVATRVAVAAFVFALAAGVAASRVYLGCHFPGDVLAGAFLGAAIGAVGARVHMARGR